jgi:hypothetical protein
MLPCVQDGRNSSPEGVINFHGTAYFILGRLESFRNSNFLTKLLSRNEAVTASGFSALSISGRPPLFRRPVYALSIHAIHDRQPPSGLSNKAKTGILEKFQAKPVFLAIHPIPCHLLRIPLQPPMLWTKNRNKITRR